MTKTLTIHERCDDYDHDVVVTDVPDDVTEGDATDLYQAMAYAAELPRTTDADDALELVRVGVLRVFSVNIRTASAGQSVRAVVLTMTWDELLGEAAAVELVRRVYDDARAADETLKC